jgi:hypothetical protein
MLLNIRRQWKDVSALGKKSRRMSFYAIFTFVVDFYAIIFFNQNKNMQVQISSQEAKRGTAKAVHSLVFGLLYLMLVFATEIREKWFAFREKMLSDKTYFSICILISKSENDGNIRVNSRDKIYIAMEQNLYSDGTKFI